MELYVQLYILINLFAILLLIAFALHSRIGMGDTLSRRYFAAADYAVITFFLSDILWFAMNYGLLPPIWWVSVLLNNVFFLSVTVAGYLWFLFLLTLADSKAVANRRSRILAFIPALVHVALCIYNLFDPILFGVAEDLLQVARAARHGKMLCGAPCIFRIHIANPLQVHIWVRREVHQILVPREFTAANLCGSQVLFRHYQMTSSYFWVMCGIL